MKIKKDINWWLEKNCKNKKIDNKYNKIFFEDIINCGVVYNNSNLDENFKYVGKAKLVSDFINTNSIDFRGLKISDDPAELANVFSILRHPGFETSRYLIAKNGKVVAQYGITTKATGSTQVTLPDKNLYETLSIIAYKVDKYNADGFYLLHNHPTGPSYPSENDLSVSRTVSLMLESLKKDINMYLGDIIVGLDDISYFKRVDNSFNKYQVASADFDKNDDYDIEIPHPMLLRSYRSYWDMVDNKNVISLYNNDNASVALYCLREKNHEITIMAIQEIDNYEFLKNNATPRHIEKEAIIDGATDVIILTNNTDVYDIVSKRGDYSAVVMDCLLINSNGSSVKSTLDSNDMKMTATPRKAHRV